jgi:soluble lytic murein transglycosylase-like protein
LRRQLCAVIAFFAAGNVQAQTGVYVREQEDGTLHLTDRPPSRGYRLVEGDMAPTLRIDPGGLRALRREDEVLEAAQRYGVDPLLVHAVIRAESGYDARAISRKGAAGLMQLMPETARRYAVSDRFDPAMNLDGGVRYLRYLLELFAGDLSLALAAYNAGERAVLRSGKKIPDYAETRTYVRRVRGFYDALRRAEASGG